MNPIRHLITAASLVAVLCAAFASQAAPTGNKAPAPATTASANTTAPSTTAVVNINTATTSELELLPGIGPSKAEAIVAFRKARPFAKPEDLMKVKGIGRQTFRKLQPLITLSGPTTATGKLHAPSTTR